MIKYFKFDFNALLLDTMQNDNEIQKNKAIIMEKLIYLMIIIIISLLGNLIIFHDQIINQQENLSFTLLLAIGQVYLIYMGKKTSRILTLLQQLNRGSNLVGDLQFLQLSLLVIYSTVNVIIIYCLTTYHFSTLLITQLLAQSMFLMHAQISNNLKLIMCVLVYIWLVQFTIHSIYDDHGMSEMGQLGSLQVQMFLNVVFILVQQKVLVTSWKEQSERVDLTFHTMHDLRNQLQSYIELNQEREEELVAKFEEIRYNSLKISNQYSSTQVNNSSEKRVKFNPSKSSDYSDIKDNKIDQKINAEQSIKINKIKAQGSILQNARSQEKNESDEDNDEKIKQQRFILYKVCFLYHMELIFENCYNLNPQVIDVRELAIQACDTLKVLFQNKENIITMDLRSMLSHIEIDATLFQYLIAEVGKFFHESGQNNIKFLFFVNYNDNEVVLQLMVLVNELSMDTVTLLMAKHIIKKLIQGLHHGVSHTLQYESDKFNFHIKIPINSDISIYKQKYSKKASKLSNKKSEIDPWIERGSVVSFKKQSDMMKSGQSFYTSNDNSRISESHLFNSFINQMNKFKKRHLVYNELILVKSKKGWTNTNLLNELNEDFTTEFKNDNIITKDQNVESKKEIKEFVEVIKIVDKVESIQKTNYIADNKEQLKKISTKKIDSFEFASMSPLMQELQANHRPVSQEEKDSMIFINVDDEENILRMNKRIFNKEGYVLNGVRNTDDFLNLLRQIYIDSIKNSTVPHIMCVMDHMLDREQGQEAAQAAIDQNKLLYLEMTFILLSSTEDKETRSKQEKLGANHAITKPLNKSKLKPILEKYIEDIKLF